MLVILYMASFSPPSPPSSFSLFLSSPTPRSKIHFSFLAFFALIGMAFHKTLKREGERRHDNKQLEKRGRGKRKTEQKTSSFLPFFSFLLSHQPLCGSRSDYQPSLFPFSCHAAVGGIFRPSFPPFLFCFFIISFDLELTSSSFFSPLYNGSPQYLSTFFYLVDSGTISFSSSGMRKFITSP